MQTARRTFIAATFVASVFTLHAAGPNAVDEAAIRKQVALTDEKGDEAAYLPDTVWWSNPFKKPQIGKSNPEDRIHPKGDVVPGSLKITTKPARIVISDSKDLAYEYSTYNLVSDTKDGRHIDINGALLRVWQKVGGEWKTASTFSRSYQE